MIDPALSDPPRESRPLSILLAGVGGAGCHIIDPLARSGLAGVRCVAIHTHQRELNQVAASEKILLGAGLLRGAGSGGDPDLGEAAAQEEAARLKALCQGIDLVIIVAGLGGGTGGGAAPAIATAAREAGALALALVTLPFDFEGTRRQAQAQASLLRLRGAADGVISLPNQKLAVRLDRRSSVLEIFAATNELLAQGVRGLWQMLTQTGLMNVTFGDLRAVLRGRHAESLLATAEAEGEARARQLMDVLTSHPLLEEGRALAEADAILVSLVGGPDLAMEDVRRVMEHFNSHADNPRLVMGAAILEPFAGKLSITVVVCRRQTEELAPLPEPSVPRASLLGEVADFNFGRGTFRGSSPSKNSGRYVPPPPDLTDEQKRALLEQQERGRGRRGSRRWMQGQLPLAIISKGRFEKSEPTLHRGEDLDIPTYIRRGVALN